MSGQITCSRTVAAVKPVASSLGDRERYDDIHAAMAALLRDGCAKTEAFQDLWRESERIKNRHNGLPPG